VRRDDSHIDVQLRSKIETTAVRARTSNIVSALLTLCNARVYALYNEQAERIGIEAQFAHNRMYCKYSNKIRLGL